MSFAVKVLLPLCLALAAPAVFAGQLSGQTPSGAYYQVEVPDGWAPVDGLVIWNKGFDLGAPAPNPDLGPLVDLQLAEGYAVAATSYGLGGWSLFGSSRDLNQFLTAFSTAFGTPAQIFVYGADIGGLVAVQAGEGGLAGNVVGALPLCAPLAGSRWWDGLVDLRLIYDAVCSAEPAARIAGGARGFPAGVDSSQVAAAVNACTGVLEPPANRSPSQQQNLALITSLTTVPESLLLASIELAGFGLADLIGDPRKLGGAQAMDNTTVVYADPVIEAQIERVSADPAARNRLFDHYTPRGTLNQTRVIALHTSQDGLVFVEHLAEYAAVAPSDRLTAVVVSEVAPTHCDFSEAEVVAGWESLRGWVAGLPQPSAADIQAACLGLVNGNLASGPCRIDPAFTAAPLANRVPERAGFVPLPRSVPGLPGGGRTLLVLLVVLSGLGFLAGRRRSDGAGSKS